MLFNLSYVQAKLYQTDHFDVQLWVLMLAAVALVLTILTSCCVCIYCCRPRKYYKYHQYRLPKPSFHNEFDGTQESNFNDKKLPLGSTVLDVEMGSAGLSDDHAECDMKKIGWSNKSCGGNSSVWRNHRFTLEELEVATNGFAEDNLIGSGDYGTVFLGILINGARVAVKKLYRTRGPDEEFLEEIQKYRYIEHKNVVKLLGYCIEGGNRMLVYEYVDNGNLYEWLHGSLSQDSTLSWQARMDIIQGVAKGLAYLHEDIEPKIIHQDIKSSNILLDHQWNPKISDFGLPTLDKRARFMSMERRSYMCPRTLTSSYPQEKSDVFGFGIIIMEIISGRIAFDDSRQLHEYLVDWIKFMIADQKITFVVDPKLPETPPRIELKRILLLALKCVDPYINARPSMGEVVHMLQPCNFLLSKSEKQMIINETSQYKSIIVASLGDSLDNDAEILGARFNDSLRCDIEICNKTVDENIRRYSF